MQTKNNYDKEVFNGDTGTIIDVDIEEHEIIVQFKDKKVMYEGTEMDELMLAYAITIHKSQGSEYPICIIPIRMSHYTMLKRNLIYTAITRCKNVCVLIGEERAFYTGVKTLDNKHRRTNLDEQLINYSNNNIVVYG
jgi:exodeoxyribonuclease V alpha subunit